MGQGPSLLLFSTGIELFGGQHKCGPILLPASPQTALNLGSLRGPKRPKPRFGHMGHQHCIIA